MPGFLTNHVNNMVLDCWFGGQAIAPPAELFVGLSLTRAFKGGFVTEPLGGGYARVAVPNDPDYFPSATLGRKSNARSVIFPSPLEGWGTVVSVFVADAPRGGHVLAMADLPRPRSVAAGDSGPTIAVRSLSFSHL